MENKIAASEKELLIQAFAKINVSVKTTSDSTYNNAIACYCICNTDGTLRWVWPTKSTKANFLLFYHTKGFKASIYSKLFNLIFILRLQSLFVHTKINLYTTAADKYTLPLKNWALFTGTIGPNRKMIMWQKPTNASARFLKISITPKSEANLLAEYKAIQCFLEKPPSSISMPEIISMQNGVLTISDVSAQQKKTNNVSGLPVQALHQWCKPNNMQLLQQTAFWQNAKQQLFFSNLITDHRISPIFLKKIESLYNSIDDTTSIQLSKSHGDFTPWNVWAKKEQLCMIDWELYNPSLPALFDVFHFVYQSSILLGNNGYKNIREKLDLLFTKSEWQVFIQEHQLNTNLLEQLYVLGTIGYNLNLFKNQSQWHTQVSWLLQTWNEAISYLANTNNERVSVLQDIQTALHNTNYAAMKFTAGAFEKLPEESDLDLCMLKVDADKLIITLKKHPLVASVVVKKRSFMYQLEAILFDGASIHIDCIFQIKRTTLEFMDCSKILQNTVKNAYHVKVPTCTDDFIYTWLFYWLNGSNIPMRYQMFFNFFSVDLRKQMNTTLTKQMGFEINDYRSLFIKDKKQLATITATLTKSVANTGFKGILNKLNYLLDTAKNLVPKKGFIITFSGVDGAGKSTIIENIKHSVEKKMRKKVIVLRHRPSILPILSAWTHGKKEAELKAATTLPRQGKNKSSISSFIRFGYYYTDYVFGQFYVYAKYVLQGYVVIYDRYYFDFINDSKRSNINLPKAFTTWWYRFLIKPKFNFFLYASAEEILARKKELDAPTITLLTTQYLNLFKKLSSKYTSSKYTPLYNKHLATTITTIESAIK